MTANDQIRASVSNGLSRPAIEALLGRRLTDDELALYRKAKAVHDLQVRKRRQERKYEHLNGTQRSQKSRDAASAIDDDLDEARKHIDWDRRR